MHGFTVNLKLTVAHQTLKYILYIQVECYMFVYCGVSLILMSIKQGLLISVKVCKGNAIILLCHFLLFWSTGTLFICILNFLITDRQMNAQPIL